MRGPVVSSLILVTGLLANVHIGAQDEQPMMAKSESGVELHSSVDLAMCRPDGIAVGGFDLISYREPDGPAAGDPAISATYDGARYLFVSEENREAFVADPEHYLPSYGGFCAITLALGRVTCPDYTNFQLEGDRLLLFEVTGFTNGRTLWNSDADGFREKADANFGVLTTAE